jgi:hypothetical protein
MGVMIGFPRSFTRKNTPAAISNKGTEVPMKYLLTISNIIRLVFSLFEGSRAIFYVSEAENTLSRYFIKGQLPLFTLSVGNFFPSMV